MQVIATHGRPQIVHVRVQIGDVGIGMHAPITEEGVHIAEESFFAMLAELMVDEGVRRIVYNLVHLHRPN